MVDVAGKPRASSSLHKTDMVHVAPNASFPLLQSVRFRTAILKYSPDVQVRLPKCCVSTALIRMRLLKHGVLVLEAMELLGKRHDGGGVRRGQRDDLAL